MPFAPREYDPCARERTGTFSRKADADHVQRWAAPLQQVIQPCPRGAQVVGIPDRQPVTAAVDDHIDSQPAALGTKRLTVGRHSMERDRVDASH